MSWIRNVFVILMLCVAGSAPPAHAAEGQRFEPIDFHAFHRHDLPRRLAAGHGALAARAGRRLGSLAFRTPAGDAYTYVPGEAGVDVVAGDEAADTVIEVEPEIFSNIVHELDAESAQHARWRVREVKDQLAQSTTSEAELNNLIGEAATSGKTETSSRLST